MRKSVKFWMLAAIFVLSGASMVGCKNKTAKQAETEVKTEAPVQSDAQVGDPINAVDDYLVNEIGKNYSQAELCIPYSYVVSTDESNPDDILVWGDFWVFNYDLSGDTLKTVSGGSHPGLMHLKKTDSGYEVTAFDAVADGSEYLPSAKRIFGDQFGAFQEINSNAEKREDLRRHFTAEYVKNHGLSATLLQDFGWPAVELPL